MGAATSRAELEEPWPSDRQERLLALEELCEISILSRGEFAAAAQRLLEAQPTAGAGRSDEAVDEPPGQGSSVTRESPAGPLHAHS
jgi:hypothetical protein